MNMSKKIGRALSVMIVLMMLTAPFFVLEGSTAENSGKAGTMAGGIDLDVTGTFIINEKTVDPITGEKGMYGQDGNITVEAGGTLIVRNATLYFIQDNGDDGIEGTPDDHHYYFDVKTGGKLILENATLKTVDWAVNPYLKLPVFIEGKAVFSDSTVMYPGMFSVDHGTLYANNTIFKGIPDAQISDNIKDKDANDDCPLMHFTDSKVVFADSRVEDYYEYKYDNETVIGLVPVSVGPQDNTTGQDVKSLWKADDNKTYDVNSKQMMYLDSFKNESKNHIPSWANPNTPVSSIILHLSWEENQSYNGTAHIYVGRDSSSLQKTDIVPSDKADMTETSLSTDEFSTLAAVEDMDVSFFHNGNSGKLPFDHLWVNATLVRTYNISVEGGHFYAINTYFDVDFRKANEPSSNGAKDVISARNGAELKFYNVTVNEDETNGMHDDFAFHTYDTGKIYLYGWAHIATYDGNASDPTEIPYCSIKSDYISTNDTWKKIVNDNNTLTNGDPILEYMNRISPNTVDETNYNITDKNGKLALPLLKDIIVKGDLNGQFVGNYMVTAHEHIHGTDTYKQINFRPYPNITSQDNSFSSNLTFSWSYPPRDLSIGPDDIAVSPSPVVRGEQALFNVTVHNMGGINVTAPFNVSLLVDGRPTDTATVDKMVERNGGTVNVILKWQTAEGDYGEHSITVSIDNASNPDGDLSNNIASISLHVRALYDLSIIPTHIWWDSPGYNSEYTYTDLTIHANISNDGYGDILGTIRVEFYVDGTLIDTENINGMNAHSYALATTIYHTTSAGNYNVSVIVSPPNGFYDDNPSNNSAYRLLSTNPTPDLIIGSMSASNTVVEYNNATISAKVENLGETYANGTITVDFYDNTTGNGQWIGNASVTGNLSARNSVTLSIVWVATAPKGDHNFYAVVSFSNSSGNPPETNTANNRYDMPSTIYVKLSIDLAISDTDISYTPAAPLTYQNITVSATIYNIGHRNITDSFSVEFLINGVDARFINVNELNSGDNITVSTVFSRDFSTTYTVSVYVDANNEIPESNESNNKASIDIFVGPRPEFSVSQPTVLAPKIVDNHTVTLAAEVTNTGVSCTGEVDVSFYDGNPASGGTLIDTVSYMDPAGGWKATATARWHASGVGIHMIYVTVTASTSPPEGDLLDNTQYSAIIVLPRPDLTVSSIRFMKDGELLNASAGISESRDFEVNVSLMNVGGNLSNSGVESFTVSLFNGAPVAGNWSNLLGNISIDEQSKLDSLDSGMPLNVSFAIARFKLNSGMANLYVIVDSDDAVDESNESNNALNATINILEMHLSVSIWTPTSDTSINMEKQTTITVTGQLLDTSDNKPVTHIPMRVSIVDTKTGETRSYTDSITWISNRNNFMAVLKTPGSPGSYRIEITASTPDGQNVNVQQSTTQFEVSRPAQESHTLWIVLLIAIIVVLASVGGGLYYIKTKYAAKYVECGNCGRMIPAGSDKCPYCGAVFDKDTVKCSVCGAWIPADAKECPKCGAKFLVGGKEIVDYETQMKQQYEDFVEKFRKQAKKEMGDEFTEDKFQQWWKTQKSYVTFEDWLKREEERKKTGGIICPVCGALNSKTDIVCHVCGSPLRPTKKKEEGAEGEEAASAIELPSLEREKEDEEKSPENEENEEAKEAATQPQPVKKKVVKKKVVKKVAVPLEQPKETNKETPPEKKESEAAELPPELIADVKQKEPEKKGDNEPKPKAPEEKPPVQKKVVKKVVKKKVVKK